MGSLRTELQIPSTFQIAQSTEELAESDDNAEEDDEEDEDMVLGSTPLEHLQVSLLLPPPQFMMFVIVPRNARSFSLLQLRSH